MKFLHVLLVSAAAAIFLAGCGGDHGQTTMPAAAPPPVSGPGTTATVTDFTVFVRQLLASTAENTKPVPLDTIIFTDQLVEGDPQPLTFFRP